MNSWHSPFRSQPWPAIVVVCAAIAFIRVGSANAINATALQIQATDGFYTAAQADRGRETYAKACTYCHRDDLSGNEDGAPALKGPAFLTRWDGRPLSELYFVIKETMPQDEPATLTAQEYADILAFMLKNSNFADGQKELPPDATALAAVTFRRPAVR